MNGATTRPASGRWSVVIAAVLVAAVAGYGASLHAPFQFDDWWAIAGDARAQSLAAWWQALPGIRPLLKLSLALNWTLSPSPWGFRLVNVAVHAANALLLAWSLRGLLKQKTPPKPDVTV